MKPTFEISADVEKLVAYLADRQHASYNEMSRHVGREIKGRDRYVLASARKILERSKGIIFGCERGVGLVRATNGQIATLSTTHPIKRMRKMTGVAQKRQARVDIQSLSAEDRLTFDVGRSVMAALRNNMSKGLQSQLAREIQKRDGGVVTINSILSLPRHRK